MSKLLSLVVSLITTLLLFGDDCRDTARLMSQAETSPSIPSNWYLAARHGDGAALQQLSDYARQHQQHYWLTLAAELGDTDSMHHLAQQASDEDTHRHWLLQAARRGHTISQYELALGSDSDSRRQYWLQQAAGNGYLLAQISLYQWYTLRNEPDKARPWLQKAALRDDDSAVLLGRLLWQQGQHAEARQWFEQAVAHGHDSRAKTYLQHIADYRFDADSLAEVTGDQHLGHCSMHLQFVANNLDGIVQAAQFRDQLARDSRLQSLALCVNRPLWLAASELECSKDWQNTGRLGCDLSTVAELAEQVSFDHLVIFSQQGKANVHNGIMYLDVTDTYQVMVHELAHFAGFVDEYPLKTTLASMHCGRASAPNLVFLDEAHPKPLSGLENWLDVAPELQLTRARTCNNHPVQAYKPVAEMTFMEYHEIANIPPVYLAMWQQQLSNKANLVPVYLNFARFYQQQGDQVKADKWWQKFRDYIASDNLAADKVTATIEAGSSL